MKARIKSMESLMNLPDDSTQNRVNEICTRANSVAFHSDPSYHVETLERNENCIYEIDENEVYSFEIEEEYDK